MGRGQSAVALAVVAGVLVIVLLTACGDDESSVDPEADTAEIEETWARFIAAARDSDAAPACAELSTDLASPEDFAPQIGFPRPAEGTQCEDYLAERSVTTNFTIDATDELESVDFHETTVEGTAGSARPTFVEEDGAWKISSLYGVPPE